MKKPEIIFPIHTDCLIIGAGSNGLFTALNLARAGIDVVILESQEPCREASGVNAGSLAIQNKQLPLIPFGLEALENWKGLHEELEGDVGYVRCGGYRVATSITEVEYLKNSSKQYEDEGVNIEWFEGDALRSKAPWLGEKVCAASFCPDDSYANPLIMGEALIRTVSAAGVIIVPRVRVIGITETPEGYTIDTPSGRCFCKKVIIAAGAWSPEIARFLGVNLQMSLAVSTMTVTEPARPVMMNVISHVRRNLSIKQFPHGVCAIGGGWQGQGNLETGRKELAYESLLNNLRLAVTVVPGLAKLHMVRCWSGFDGVTPDALPYFGRLPDHENAFILAFVTAGWGLAPSFGRLMAELVMTNRTSLPVDDFDPGRFKP